MSKKLIKFIVIISSILVMLALVYFLNLSGVFAKDKLDITCTDRTISWSFSGDKPLQGGYYILYRDGEEVYRGAETEFVDAQLGDKEPPEDIRHVEIEDYISSYGLSWDEPKDMGTDYNFIVYYIDNYGVKKFKSSKYTYNFATQIEGYTVYLGDKIFEAEYNEYFYISKDELEEGVLDLKIVAIDSQNNRSKPIILDRIRCFFLELTEIDGKYTIHNSDQEQEYTYSILTLGEDGDGWQTIELTEDYFDLKDYFVEYSNLIPSIECIDYSHLFYVNDIPTCHYTIEGIGKTYNNKVYSYTDWVHHSGVLYYAVNRDSNYKITDKDAEIVYTRDTCYFYICDLHDEDPVYYDNYTYVGIDMHEGQEPYYLHVAMRDGVSYTMSDTYSYKLTFDEAERKEYADSLFVKSENLSDYKYRLERDSLAKLPLGIMKLVKHMGLEIRFVDGGQRLIYDPEIGEDVEHEWAGMYSDHIYINSMFEDYSIIVHEIGHVVDFYFYETAGMHLHYRDDFMNIYEKEKDRTYYDNDYIPEGASEYFAESFLEYIHNPSKLKKYAPLTYEYMKELVNSF